jgi:hypothetical protein
MSANTSPTTQRRPRTGLFRAGLWLCAIGLRRQWPLPDRADRDAANRSSVWTHTL